MSENTQGFQNPKIAPMSDANYSELQGHNILIHDFKREWICDDTERCLETIDKLLKKKEY